MDKWTKSSGNGKLNPNTVIIAISKLSEGYMIADNEQNLKKYSLEDFDKITIRELFESFQSYSKQDI